MSEEFIKKMDMLMGIRQGIDESLKTNKMYCFLLNKAIEMQGRSLKLSLGIEEPKTELEGYYCVPSIKYHEEICDDYEVDRDFDNPEKSYIYRIAVLSVIDGNKSDWVHFYIGLQREKEDKEIYYQFIGELYFGDGENADIESSIERIKKGLKNCWW